MIQMMKAATAATSTISKNTKRSSSNFSFHKDHSYQMVQIANPTLSVVVVGDGGRFVVSFNIWHVHDNPINLVVVHNIMRQKWHCC